MCAIEGTKIVADICTSKILFITWVPLEVNLRKHLLAIMQRVQFKPPQLTNLQRRHYLDQVKHWKCACVSSLWPSVLIVLYWCIVLVNLLFDERNCGRFQRFIALANLRDSDHHLKSFYVLCEGKGLQLDTNKWHQSRFWPEAIATARTFVFLKKKIKINT